MRLRIVPSVSLFIGFFGAMNFTIADSKSDLAKAYSLYKKGAYPQAIQHLSIIQGGGNKDTQAMVEYWLALCHSRMQAFDKAVVGFRKASQLGAKIEDLDYELGQALYASQELKSARQAFKSSIEKKFKIGASYYYIGFISQLLEEYPKALDYYKSIQKFQDDEEKVKQPALLQISEVRLAQAEQIKDDVARKYNIKDVVIPSYQRVVAYHSSGPLSQQATARINELRTRYRVSVSKSSWILKATSDSSYDTNVVTQADEALIQVSNTASFVQKTGASFNTKWSLDAPWSVTPDIAANYTIYLNRGEPKAYQNDNFSLSPAIRTWHDHTIAGSMASTIFDFEMNYMLRDYRQERKLSFYSRSFNLILGERARLLGSASTTVKANFKLYSSYDEGQNAINPGISVIQNLKGFKEVGITLSFSWDYNRARDAINDRVNYRFSPSVNVPAVLKNTDLNASLNLTVVDTKNQQSSRGWEKTISPSITANHQFGPNFGGNLNYSYTKNFSNDKQNYAYSKHVAGFGLSYRF